jgi:hypothetical protein
VEYPKGTCGLRRQKKEGKKNSSRRRTFVRITLFMINVMMVIIKNAKRKMIMTSEMIMKIMITTMAMAMAMTMNVVIAVITVEVMAVSMMMMMMMMILR